MLCIRPFISYVSKEQKIKKAQYLFALFGVSDNICRLIHHSPINVIVVELSSVVVGK